MPPSVSVRAVPEACDLVMKGGITSGIIYPPAVYEISRRFRLASVGGTSAGAIGAGAAAAAEYCRQTRDDGGYQCLNQVAEELAVPGKLVSLFQPTPSAKAGFEALLAWLGGCGWRGALRSLASGRGVALVVGGVSGAVGALALVIVWAAVSSPLASGGAAGPTAEVPWWPWVAGAMGLSLLDKVVHWRSVSLTRVCWQAMLWSALALLLWRAGVALAAGPPARWLTAHALSLGSFVLYGVGGVVGLLSAGLLAPGQRLLALLGPEHRWGLCPGTTQHGAQGEGLTDWLHGKIQQLAGRWDGVAPSKGAPLTFGDLQSVGVNLRLMTTCLTLGRPYSFPMAASDSHRFHWRREEFEGLFPADVVEFMAERAAGVTTTEEGWADQLPLPEPADLPIIVAVRMSLSFPVLFCAVPLWRMHYYGKEQHQAPHPERAWFVDGGLCSNLPIQMFDRLLPRRPTLALNLEYLAAGEAVVADGIVQPETNLSRQQPRWAWKGTGGVLGLLGAAFDTAKGWQDNTQMVTPGYRDRLVHVTMAADEGGMNLEMPKEVIDRIAARGRQAGKELAERFAAPTHPMGWCNHRWVRYRAVMARLEEAWGDLRQLNSELEGGLAGLAEPPDLFDPVTGDPVHPYQRPYNQPLAKVDLEALAALTDAWRPCFVAGEPRPSSELGIRPRV